MKTLLITRKTTGSRALPFGFWGCGGVPGFRTPLFSFGFAHSINGRKDIVFASRGNFTPLKGTGCRMDPRTEGCLLIFT